MKTTPAQDLSAGAPGLSDLDRVHLEPPYTGMLAATGAACLGPKTWVLRKQLEAFEVLAMAQLAPRRMAVARIDLEIGFLAEISLRAPVVRRQGQGSDVSIGEGVRLVLRYPQEAIRSPQPGFPFVEIVEPSHVFHPNVAPTPPHFLCLGETLPAGIRCKELIMMSYGALAMTTLMIDPREGVMNLDAATFFAACQDSLPLSREPFLEPA